MSLERSSGWIGIIAAAVITGLFALAPQIYDYFSNKKLLEYNVEASQILSGLPEKQVFFIRIINSGSGAVADIVGAYSMPGVQFTDSDLKMPIGVKGNLRIAEDAIIAEVSELNPGESAALSFLVQGNIPTSGEFSVRARGLSSDNISPLQTGESIDSLFNKPLTLFVFLSGYIIFISFVIMFMRKRGISSSLFLRISDREMDRREAINFVSKLCFINNGKFDIIYQDCYFSEFSDIVLLEAKSKNISTLDAIKAQLCLLRCKMAESSKKIIERNIIDLSNDEIGNKIIEDSGKIKTTDIRSDLQNIAHFVDNGNLKSYLDTL